MRILQVVPFFPPAFAFGGPVPGAYHLSKELVNRGHEVAVYTTDARDFSSRLDIPFVRVLDGVRIHAFKNLSMLFVRYSNLFLTLNLIPKAQKELRSFDLIHLHGYRLFQHVIISHFARKYDVPYILQANGTLVYLGRSKRKRVFDILWGHRLLKEASKLIALTSFEAEQYGYLGLSDEKITVIPSAFDLSEYRGLALKGRFRAKHNIRKDERIILYLGRIHQIKGLDILVKAFSKIVKEHTSENVCLSIVGPDDGFLGELRSLIRYLNIEDSVLFTGPLYGVEKFEAYADADIFVLPSRYEAFSRSLREAYAFGKPVIASKVGGLSEMIVNDKTGILTKPEDTEQLAHAMLSLLSDHHKAKKMGERGKQFLKENFTMEKTMNKIEELYREVTSIQAGNAHE